MKIAIVVGHNSRAQGARSITGVTEFVWNSRLAEMVQDHNPQCVKIFHRESIGGYSREIDRVYAQVNEWDADCSIELHFNAVANPAASGGLTISSGTAGSLALAHEIQGRCIAVMENRNRGVLVRQRHDRGGRSLWQGRAPAVMTEPFFGSNEEEMRKADARADQLAEAIYRGASRFCQSYA